VAGRLRLFAGIGGMPTLSAARGLFERLASVVEFLAVPSACRALRRPNRPCLSFQIQFSMISADTVRVAGQTARENRRSWHRRAADRAALRQGDIQSERHPGPSARKPGRPASLQGDVPRRLRACKKLPDLNLRPAWACAAPGSPSISKATRAMSPANQVPVRNCLTLASGRGPIWPLFARGICKQQVPQAVSQKAGTPEFLWAVCPRRPLPGEIADLSARVQLDRSRPPPRSAAISKAPRVVGQKPAAGASLRRHVPATRVPGRNCLILASHRGPDPAALARVTGNQQGTAGRRIRSRTPERRSEECPWPPEPNGGPDRLALVPMATLRG
jgi:hypothetical protein